MLGFPGDPDSKESACDAGDLGSIPGLGRSLGEWNSSDVKVCKYIYIYKAKRWKLCHSGAPFYIAIRGSHLSRGLVKEGYGEGLAKFRRENLGRRNSRKRI